VNKPYTFIDQEMLNAAIKASKYTTVNRTKTSPYDTVLGLIGELIFAKWYLKNWKLHNLYDTKGKVDFFGEIEIKTSAYPYQDNLHLLVREDYAKKRKPKFYVQILLDIPKEIKEIKAGMKAILIGYAMHEQVDEAPLKDFGSKLGGESGYKCHYVPFNKLLPMHLFEFSKELEG
jgi:hypothetical protein